MKTEAAIYRIVQLLHFYITLNMKDLARKRKKKMCEYINKDLANRGKKKHKKKNLPNSRCMVFIQDSINFSVTYIPV